MPFARGHDEQAEHGKEERRTEVLQQLPLEAGELAVALAYDCLQGLHGVLAFRNVSANTTRRGALLQATRGLQEIRQETVSVL